MWFRDQSQEKQNQNMTELQQNKVIIKTRTAERSIDSKPEQDP